MEQQIVIVYNPITQTIQIKENDFSNFEAFGLLEAAKQMIAHDWLMNTEGESPC